MLVLARRKEESIVIGDDIVVTVLGIEGEKVKLGIEAPNQVRIWRKELYEAIADQMIVATKIAASEAKPAGLESLRQLLATEIQEKDAALPVKDQHNQQKE